MWSTAEQAEYARIRKMRQLFEGQHNTYFISVNDEPERIFDYMTINVLGDFVSQTWKRFLFREFPTFSTLKPLVPFVESLDLPTVCLPAEIRKSYAGYSILRLYYSELQKKPVLQLWGSEEGQFTTFEYISRDPSTPFACTFWSLKDPNAQATDRIYIGERYELIYNIATMTPIRVEKKMEAYSYDLITNGPGTVMDWGKVWEGDKFPPVQSLSTPKLLELPFVKIHNFDRNGDGTGDSDYTTSLIDVQRNVNRLMAGRALVCYITETPVFDIPAEFLDGQNKLDLNKYKFRVRQAGGMDDSAEIKLTNWTGNLENSTAQMNYYIDFIFQLTGISPAMAGLLDSEARSGLARRMGMIPTEAEITSRRHQWNKGFNDIIRKACLLQNAFGVSNVTPAEFTYTTWQSALPGEDTSIQNMLLTEFNNGLRSLDSTMRLLPLNRNADPLVLEAEITEMTRSQKLFRTPPRKTTPDSAGERKQI